MRAGMDKCRKQHLLLLNMCIAMSGAGDQDYW